MDREQRVKAAIQRAIDELWVVNRDGSIYSKRYKRLLKLTKDKMHGYLTVNVTVDGRGRTTKAHRITAQVFIPNPDNLPQVNHKNGIRHDNRVENLEWCTNQYNVQDGYNRGRVAWSKIKRP